jgi:tetratricopeptide (TPR) repeat protein
VSKENKPDEKELWKKIPSTQGADRADAYIELSHLAYDRGDHKAALALCQSAREIYEGLTTYVGTSQLLHVYEGITWSLRRLDRDAEAAQVALDAVALLNEEDPLAATEMFRDAGRFYYAAGEYEKSLECHNKAIADCNPDMTDTNMGCDEYNCGSTLVQLKRYAEALPHLLAARSYFKKSKEPERIFYCDEYITVCYIELNNSVEAINYAQKTLDFAVTAQKRVLETWARYRMGCAKVLIGELDVAEEELREALSMNASSSDVDWDLAVEVELEIVKILITKGRVAEADEITRRLANLKDILEDEDEKK